MKYRLVKNVFLDGEVREAGTVVEFKDEEQAKALLERGSIVVDNGKAPKVEEEPVVATEPSAPAPTEEVDAPQPPLDPAVSEDSSVVTPTPEQVAEDFNNLEIQ